MTGALHDLADTLRAAEALTERLELASSRMTEAAALLGGLQINDVLWSGSGQLHSSGLWSRTFRVPYAAVAVSNRQATTPLYVVADRPARNRAPAPDLSTSPVAPSPPATSPAAQIQIIGSSGNLFDIEVLARPVTPICISNGATGGGAGGVTFDFPTLTLNQVSDPYIAPEATTFSFYGAGAGVAGSTATTFALQVNRSTVATVTLPAGVSEPGTSGPLFITLNAGDALTAKVTAVGTGASNASVSVA